MRCPGFSILLTLGRRLSAAGVPEDYLGAYPTTAESGALGVAPGAIPFHEGPRDSDAEDLRPTLQEANSCLLFT